MSFLSRVVIASLHSRLPCPGSRRFLASSEKFAQRKRKDRRSVVIEESNHSSESSESSDRPRPSQGPPDRLRRSVESSDGLRPSRKQIDQQRHAIDPDQSGQLDFEPNMDPSTISLSQLQSFASRGKYLIMHQGGNEKQQVQYSKDFMDFLISWCKLKCDDIAQGRLDPIEAAYCMANVLHTMKLTLKELGKKKKPRETAMVEMSRLYWHGLEKLAEESEHVEKQPITVHRILCQYADACCNFDYDPSTSQVDIWPFWFRVARFFLEEVDSEEKWKGEETGRKKTKQDFNEAYAHLLSIIIDVTLRFHRAYEFGTIKFAWESRLATHLSNFKERNSYILSLRMATLAQKHGLEFDHLVAKTLMVRGIQRSFDEYQFRKGLAAKPNRSVQESLKEDLTKGS